MSLGFSPSFPGIDALSIIVGTAYSGATSFIVQRPVFGAVWQKAQTATTPKEVLESKETQTAAASALTSLAASALQSYGVSALLRLTDVKNYKGAAIVGALVLAAQSGPQLIQNIFVTKQPLDVILSSLAVKLLDTVGLALALQFYKTQTNQSTQLSESISRKL